MISEELPIAGTVLRFAYLWSHEIRQGITAPSKERPVALVVAHRPESGSCVVLPITHTEPCAPTVGIEIPDATRRRLGLDDERQWIILTDVNVFVWPGADLRPVPHREPETAIYGRLGRAFYEDVLAQLQTLIRARCVNLALRKP